MRTFRYLLPVVAILTHSLPCVAADEQSGFTELFKKLNEDRWYISNGWANGDHQSCEFRADGIRISDSGMRLTLSDRGGHVRPIGCPEIHTRARLGYGIYTARLRTAAGSGLNTAFFTYIGPPNGVPDWDEIDFEFLGKNPRSVSINYRVNGVEHGPRDIQFSFDASQAFHDYTIEWTPERICWYADDKMIAKSPDGDKIPSTPGMLFFSLWSGSSVEDAWMGPFTYKEPVTAEVQSASFRPTTSRTCPVSSVSDSK
jgi:endo-1,3-1,4-beta-glycanase ExoK